jgi:hypothetical protein
MLWKLLCVSIMLSMISCKKEPNSSDGKAVQGSSILKRVSMVSSTDSKEPMYIIDEYEYNSVGQISKISSPRYAGSVISGISYYRLYEYSGDGKLLKIRHFQSNGDLPETFYNSENHIFSFSTEGKKEQETIEYPQNNTSLIKLFKYEATKLVRVENYGTTNTLENYTLYEYDFYDKLVRENFYGKDDELYTFTVHSWSNGLNIKSDVYLGSNSEHFREIHKTYDKDNNLVYYQSHELLMSSSMGSYVFMYEYNK